MSDNFNNNLDSDDLLNKDNYPHENSVDDIDGSKSSEVRFDSGSYSYTSENSKKKCKKNIHLLMKGSAAILAVIILGYLVKPKHRFRYFLAFTILFSFICIVNFVYYFNYISFVSLLKKHQLDNITFVTSDNKEQINNILNEFNNGSYSISLLNEALNNYNSKYGKNLNIEEFASKISKYASSVDKNGMLIADETIAEAIHDYYLHDNNMKNESKEIIDVINKRL